MATSRPRNSSARPNTAISYGSRSSIRARSGLVLRRALGGERILLTDKAGRAPLANGDQHPAALREWVRNDPGVAHRHRDLLLRVPHAKQQRRPVMADGAVEHRAGQDV